MHAGWTVGTDRVERIWRCEGLKVPQKQKPRGRLWFNDGSCVRLRPTHVNHVWSYDFVSVRTHDGRMARTLNLIDEHTREALLVRFERRWSSAKVIGALADAMVAKGVPGHLRSDNGPEFVAHDLRKWLADTGAKTAYIEPGSPWENGYCESFHSKMRDEFLNGEIFYSMKELRVLAERCASTTTPSARTPRWAIDHQRQRYGWHRPLGRRRSRSLRSRLLRLPYPASIRTRRSLRYTNNPTVQNFGQATTRIIRTTNIAMSMLFLS